MHEELMDKISNKQSRIEDAAEFFGWPVELVAMMFKHSKQDFEGAWERFYPDYVYEYYAASYYAIRQLSYSKGDIFTERITKFLNEVEGSCLDYACGVGDYAMYLAYRGVKVFVYEHPGLPVEFLKFRFKKYGLDIPVMHSNEVIETVPVDFALLISAIDHIEDPVSFVKKVSDNTSKKIFATPCIDENYDRPTHIKSILKDVPSAFDLIRQHNEQRGYA